MNHKWIFSFLLICFSTAYAQIPANAHFKQVLWIVLENQNGTTAEQDPFFQEFAQSGVELMSMTGEFHPSQPNYFAMIAGSTMGSTNDNNIDLSGSHLGDLLEQKNLTWKNYAEAFPGNCFQGAKSGKYARKHIPFISFKNIQSNPTRCANIVGSDQFDQDLQSGTLPDYAMYTPDLNNDGHDTSMAYAGKFLEQKFGSLFRDPQFMRDRLVVITFDESETHSDNKIITLLLGGNLQPGIRNTQNLNHVSLLRMIEDNWALGNLGRDDVRATAPTGIWK